MSLEKALRATVWAHLHILPTCCGAFLVCAVVISKISTALRVLVCPLVHVHARARTRAESVKKFSSDTPAS